MNFGNLKTNLRFIFAGIVGIGLRHYIEMILPSKMILTVVLIISIVCIITGGVGIYNEFKNRKSGDLSPQNNIKSKRIKTKEEKEGIEIACKGYEAIFSIMENDIKNLEKKYNELMNKYVLEEDFDKKENLRKELEYLEKDKEYLRKDISEQKNSLHKNKLLREDTYGKIENEALEVLEKRLNEISKKEENLSKKIHYDRCMNVYSLIEEDIKSLEEDYNEEDMKELKEDLKFWRKDVELDKSTKEGSYGKLGDKELRILEERLKEIERKIKILETSHQGK